MPDNEVQDDDGELLAFANGDIESAEHATKDHLEQVLAACKRNGITGLPVRVIEDELVKRSPA